MRVLIIGGDSKLGMAMRLQLQDEGHHDVISTTRRSSGVPGYEYLDMLKPALPIGYRAFGRFDGGMVVFSVAAVTGLARCEQDRTTWRINADAPVILAREAQFYGHACVFVSSDAVEACPHTAYAMQKAHAELGVIGAGGRVFRPSRIVNVAAAASAVLAMGERSYPVSDRWEPEALIVRWEDPQG